MKKYLITRILGNDLPSIHGKNQTIDNLLFTIINERKFDNTDTLYILNRIIDPKKRRDLIDLLNKYSIAFIEIEFDYNEYKKIPDIDEKTKDLLETLLIQSNSTDIPKYKILSLALSNHRLYCMNINMARNYCIEYGKKNGYEWIFVLDSNHFFTETLYNDIINNIKKDTEYITIPQKRLSDAKLENESILTSPEKIKNIPAQEHQLAFKNTSTYVFNEQIPYGSMDKGEMLNALGVPGKWNGWNNDLEILNIKQRHFLDIRYQTLSSVIRLHPQSENNSIEKNWIHRMLDTYRIMKNM